MGTGAVADTEETATTADLTMIVATMIEAVSDAFFWEGEGAKEFFKNSMRCNICCLGLVIFC